MTPAQLPLNLYRGDTYRWTIKVWTDEGKTQAADLSTATAKAQIRSQSGTNVVALNCTITLPNTVNMDLDAASSRKLTTAQGRWDLELTYSSGVVATILAGQVNVTADVTHA
jgi:hypothetical protein